MTVTRKIERPKTLDYDPLKPLSSSKNSFGDRIRAAIPITSSLTVDAAVKKCHEWSLHVCSTKPKDAVATITTTTSTKTNVSLLALLRYSTWSERGWMIFGLLMAFLSGVGVPAWLILLAQSLDKFSNLAKLVSVVGEENLMNQVQQELNRLVIAFVLVGVVALLSGASYVAIWTYTGERQAFRIQEAFVRAVLQQDAAWLDAQEDRQAFSSQMTSSIYHIRRAIGRNMADTFALSVSAAGSLAVALVLNAPLALVMLCVVPVVGILVLAMSCWTRSLAAKASHHMSLAGALASEVVSGIKTVTALNAQHWARQNYELHVDRSQRLSIRSSFLSALMVGLSGSLFYCTYTVAFFIGTQQVANDAAMGTIIICLFSSDPTCRVTGASVMCCIYGVILFVTFFGLMSPSIQALNAGRQAAGDLVFGTIQRYPTIDIDQGETLPEGSLKGELTWKNVYFAYPSRPNQILFKNLTLTVKPGESLALVGPSGSGKSTISRLLLRYYDLLAGDITVDGISLQQLQPKWWRDQVGYVSQEPILFPGTLLFNIAVGKPGGPSNATREEVIAAAKVALAHEFISDLPDGYDTFYSGSGLMLSGGQVQRISIARAVIKNPTVLLLDEATSALDAASEKHVLGALANVRKIKRMTTVTVAHRLTTIIGCDQIAVVANGGIAELGTHKSLMEQDGIYSALCASQGITAVSKGIDVSAATNNGVDKQSEAITSPIVAGMIDDNGNIDIEMNDNSPMKQQLDRSEKGDQEVDLALEELAPISRLFQYAIPESLYTIAGLLGSLIVGALSPAESILTANIVANFYIASPDEMVAFNKRWILSFLYFALASLVGNAMIGCGLSVSGQRLTTRMRVMLFNSIIRRTMGWFDVPDHSTGELTARLGTDAEAVAGVTGIQLGYRVRVTSSLVTGVVIALVYSWKIGLVALACIPLIMLAGTVQSLCLNRRHSVTYHGLSPATILEQGLRGISSIQAYNLQKLIGDDYAAALAPESSGMMKDGIIAGLVYGFSQFAIFISFAIIFFVGSILLTRVEIDFVHFFAPVLSVMFGAIGASQVCADFKSRQDGQAAAARIFAILDEPFDGTDPFSAEGKTPDSLSGFIKYDKCHFAYPSRPDRLIFFDSDGKPGLSLDINAKESVAFVGRSGCGKSTAQALVLRFYEATAGHVMIDGMNIEDLNVTWLRRNIGYVGQNPVLFSGTVKNNILLGKPDATDEEVMAAAKASNAHDFIMALENGYDTDIGPSGCLLSGGQRQRIAISRAIVSNPAILILDEATSALDNESEKVVQDALNRLQAAQPRTTLIVAHRLTTVKDCDKIVVLGGGGVEEMGNHASLLNSRGIYHQLWKLQGAVEDEPDQRRSSYLRFSAGQATLPSVQ